MGQNDSTSNLGNDDDPDPSTVPLSPPIARRWVPVQDEEESPPKPEKPEKRLLTVLTQNVLAPRYTSQLLYPWVSQPSINLNGIFRTRRLAQILKLYQGDIVCLQELQGDMLQILLDSESLGETYEHVFKPITRRDVWNTKQESQFPVLSENGDVDVSEEDEMEWRKRRVLGKEGVGILWKREEFELESKTEIEFNKVVFEEANRVITEESTTHPEEKKRIFVSRLCLNSHNVALIVVLRRREDGEKILIATIHGFFKKSWWSEQIYQYEHLLNKVDEVRKREGVEKIVVCGDFNMKGASSNALRFVENGNVDAELDALEATAAGEEERSKKLTSIWLDLLKRRPRHGLTLRQAYPSSLKPVTHYSKRELAFDCLDYVFHSVGSLVAEEVLRIHPGVISEELPNEEEYSDHLMLGVKFDFRDVD